MCVCARSMSQAPDFQDHAREQCCLLEDFLAKDGGVGGGGYLSFPRFLGENLLPTFLQNLSCYLFAWPFLSGNAYWFPDHMT